MKMQTEFSFKLPHGYKDEEGNMHSEGVMRLATAYDEIMPMRDHRVQSNPAYLIIMLLARVIIRLGNLEKVNTHVIEGLFSADLAFLQDFYRRINENGHARLEVACPHCGKNFNMEADGLGGT
ncbi:MAG: phage tail assembly protein [bacterium]